MATSVFGYGSLIFKPPPYPELTSEPGFIKGGAGGFVRRFAQESHDHRGTEEKPGRVVTLVTAEDWEVEKKDDPPTTDHVWGRIYRIPQELSQEVWAYLDYREKDGYTLRHVDVFGVDEKGQEVVVEKDCRVYVGETSNDSFGGGMPMGDLAQLIATAEGPSGPNREYLYMLCDCVKKLCPESEDMYLKELETKVRKAAGESGGS